MVPRENQISRKIGYATFKNVPTTAPNFIPMAVPGGRSAVSRDGRIIEKKATPRLFLVPGMRRYRNNRDLAFLRSIAPEYPIRTWCVLLCVGHKDFLIFTIRVLQGLVRMSLKARVPGVRTKQVQGLCYLLTQPLRLRRFPSALLLPGCKVEPRRSLAGAKLPFGPDSQREEEH